MSAGTSSTGRKLAAALLVGALVAPAAVVAAPREVPSRRAKPVRPVSAPDARRIHPANRIAIVCDECVDSGASPDWVIALGIALDSRGFSLSPIRRDTASLIARGQKSSFLAVISREMPPPAVPGTAPAKATAAVPVIHLPEPIDGTTAAWAVSAVEDLVRPQRGGPAPVRYLVVTSEQSDVDRVLGAQATWVARYSKLDIDFMDVAELGTLPAAMMDRYAVVGLAVDSIPRAQAARFARFATEYVEKGGGLAALAGLPGTEFLELLGVEKVRREGVPVKTYACETRFLPGAGGIEFVNDPEAPEKLDALVLAEGSEVLCSGAAAGHSIPLAFAHARGAGRTLAWNGGALADKSARGLILSSLLEVAPPAAAAMIDAMVFWVDDCPLPVWSRMAPPVDKAYGMTDADFYVKVWVPAMSALFQRHKLRPTFAFMATYSDEVEPPFGGSGYGDGDDPSSRLARDVAAVPGAEIGLHGFNHQSLTVAGSERSVGWPGREAMEAALRKAREEMQRVLGKGVVPRVYAAPNNLIQKVGKEAVRVAFPEITTIATQYLDEDVILGQEFGPDPDVPGVTDIPRISSEHFVGPDAAREMLDALVSPGVFSHFVHPDDIFDTERSRGKTFEDMVRSLDEILSRVETAYPFMRRRSASDFAAEVRSYMQSRLDATRGPAGLALRAVDPPPFGLTVMVRTRPGVTLKASGCETVFAAPAEGRHYIRVGNGVCSIAWQ